MIGNPILLLLVVGPMAAAVIGYLIGRVNKSARDYFADAVTILAFLTMVYFFPDLQRRAAGIIVCS